jgi:hypothetical protein
MEAGMETKLMLKMDQAVINLAKKYAETNQKFPLLIEELSGVISENDLRKLTLEDEKARYILREER